MTSCDHFTGPLFLNPKTNRCECKTNAVLLGDNVTCKCTDGYFNKNGECAPESECTSQLRTVVDGECVCVSGAT